MKGKRKSKSRRLLETAMREVHNNPPTRMKRTKRKKGKAAAETQMRAAAYSKARAKGGRYPKKK